MDLEKMLKDYTNRKGLWATLLDLTELRLNVQKVFQSIPIEVIRDYEAKQALKKPVIKATPRKKSQPKPNTFLHSQEKFLANPTANPVGEIIYQGMITKTWQILSDTVAITSKTYRTGDIELIAEMPTHKDNYLENDNLEKVLGDLSLATLEVFQLLGILGYKQSPCWEKLTTVTGSQLLQLLKRVKGKKSERLKTLASEIALLKTLKVAVNNWTYGKGKKQTSFKFSFLNLLEMKEIKPVYGADNQQLLDLEITYQIGRWAAYFANGNEHLKQFCYTPISLFSLNHYHNYLAKKMGFWLQHKLKQHPNGDFKLKTILEQIDENNQLQLAREDGVKALTLKNSLERALEQLNNLNIPYSIEYKKGTPEWLLPKNETRQPKNWFEQWLECVIIIQQPASPPLKVQSPIVKTSNKKAAITGKDIRESREKNQITLEYLAKCYGCDKSWLSKLETGKIKLKPKTAQELMTSIEIIAKKSSRKK